MGNRQSPMPASRTSSPTGRPATARNASTSSPESISSRTAMLGRNTPNWSTSLRFRSPPEDRAGPGKEALVETDSARFRGQEKPDLLGVTARGCERFTKCGHQAYPGNLDRVLQGEEEPGAACAATPASRAGRPRPG